MAGLWDSLGGYGSTAVSWMTTTAFWVGLMIVIVAFGFLFLYLRKRRKMNKLVLEMYDLGDGRFDFKTTAGGWFKSRFTLGGLWDYGAENLFRLKDMTPVHNVSHNDYRILNGKSCIVVIRNPHDPKIAFPVSRFFIGDKSKAVMSEVAPADYREAASKAIEQADTELTSKWQQYAPLIITGVVVIICLIMVLLNTQYGKYMVDKAATLLEIAKTTPCQAIPSTSGAP